MLRRRWWSICSWPRPDAKRFATSMVLHPHFTLWRLGASSAGSRDMPDKSQKWSGFLGGRLHDANGDRKRLRGGLCASPWAGRGWRAPGSGLRAGGSGSGGAGRALSGGAVECRGGCGSGVGGPPGQPSDVGSRSSQHQPPMSRRVAQPHRPAASPSCAAQLPAASVLQTRPCWLASPAAPPRRLPVPRQTACLARCGSE